MEQLIYRNAVAGDLEDVVRLGMLAYGEFLDQLTPDNRELLDKGLRDREKMKHLLSTAVSFVCTDKEYVAGMAFLVPSGNPTAIYPADWSYIRMVGVDPAYRGKGIARRLTQFCIDAARQKDEKTIALHTSEMMDAARHIYEDLGFLKWKELDPIFGKKYWLYKLDISLPDIEQL